MNNQDTFYSLLRRMFSIGCVDTLDSEALLDRILAHIAKFEF